MDKNTLFSSFGNYVKLLKIIKGTQQDKYTKKLTTKAYLLLFLHAQLQQGEGLRAIADDTVLEELQREPGLQSISFSQLPVNTIKSDPSCYPKYSLILFLRLK